MTAEQLAFALFVVATVAATLFVEWMARDNASEIGSKLGR